MGEGTSNPTHRIHTSEFQPNGRDYPSTSSSQQVGEYADLSFFDEDHALRDVVDIISDGERRTERCSELVVEVVVDEFTSAGYRGLEIWELRVSFWFYALTLVTRQSMRR